MWRLRGEKGPVAAGLARGLGGSCGGERRAAVEGGMPLLIRGEIELDGGRKGSRLCGISALMWWEIALHKLHIDGAGCVCVSLACPVPESWPGRRESGFLFSFFLHFRYLFFSPLAT